MSNFVLMRIAFCHGVHCNDILMIIFPIKTFQKQLKLLQDSLKTIFFHFR